MRDGGYVLVADDSAVVRKVLGDRLGEQGWTVREAADGAEALAVCREAPPEVVLLDIEMPRLNGYQVLAALKAEPELEDVPVIFLTARGGGQRPRFGERARQQVVEHPPEQRARGQAERERGQHHPPGAVPAEGGQPAELYADGGGQHGGGEELGQCGEHRRGAAPGPSPVEASVPSPASRSRRPEGSGSR